LALDQTWTIDLVKEHPDGASARIPAERVIMIRYGVISWSAVQ